MSYGHANCQKCGREQPATWTKVRWVPEEWSRHGFDPATGPDWTAAPSPDAKEA